MLVSGIYETLIEGKGREKKEIKKKKKRYPRTLWFAHVMEIELAEESQASLDDAESWKQRIENFKKLKTVNRRVE